jgi:hypothetical protein
MGKGNQALDVIEKNNVAGTLKKIPYLLIPGISKYHVNQ